MEQEHQHQYETQTVGEDYAGWKKRAGGLYDMVQLCQLTSYSSSFQWSSLKETTEDGTEVCLYAFVGTSTVENNRLMHLKIFVPAATRLIDTTEHDIHEAPKPFALKRIQLESQVPQDAEVLRARCNPLKSSLVASKCSGAYCALNLYDFTEGGSSTPVVRLEGHTAEGYGLDWNKQKPSYLASGSSDGKICVWDVASSKETDSSLEPIVEYEFHGGCVEDVGWSKFNPNVLASSGQDRLVAIWDIRDRKKGAPQFEKVAHQGHIYTLDFSPFNDTLLLSGGDDCEIALWDLRNLAKRVQTFIGHENSVGKVQWSPAHRQLFSSASNDRRVVLWDSSRCGEIDEYGQPAEIVFIHAGHQSALMDCDWSAEGFAAGSVDEQGRLAVWRPAEPIMEHLNDLM